MTKVDQAIAAIKGRDWDDLKLLLHPYLHWTCADGRVIRGRKNVLAHLAASSIAGPPSSHELRDSQIYRWSEKTAGRD
jgi:hypothetical protein